MDAAYDAEHIRKNSRSLGHVLLIDINTRGNTALKAERAAEARRLEHVGFQLPEDVRYNERMAGEERRITKKDLVPAFGDSQFNRARVQVDRLCPDQNGRAALLAESSQGVEQDAASKDIAGVTFARHLRCHPSTRSGPRFRWVPDQGLGASCAAAHDPLTAYRADLFFSWSTVRATPRGARYQLIPGRVNGEYSSDQRRSRAGQSTLVMGPRPVRVTNASRLRNSTSREAYPALIPAFVASSRSPTGDLQSQSVRTKRPALGPRMDFRSRGSGSGF